MIALHFRLLIHPRNHSAFSSQTCLGWHNFYRGLVSDKWKKIKYRYYVEIDTKDIYAVDKWARNLVYSLIEYVRLMWKERCDIVAAERDASYEGRQRRQLQAFCKYLQLHPDMIPQYQRSLIMRDDRYFQSQPLNNLLMWKRKIGIILDPTIIDQRNKLTSHFKKSPKPNQPVPKSSKRKQKTIGKSENAKKQLLSKR